jgi:hypothetical protein
MVESFGFEMARIGRIIIPILQYLINLFFSVIIIIIGVAGFNVKKSSGWLLILIYGFVSLVVYIPNIFYIFGHRFFPIENFAMFLQGFNFIMAFFRIGGVLLLVLGLYLFFKEYRKLLENKSHS